MSGVVFFDIDGTLINGQTQKMLAVFAFNKGLISLMVLLKTLLWFIFYKIGIAKNGANITAESYKTLKGMKVDRFNSLLLDLFKSKIKPKIFIDASCEIKKHLNENREVVLVSNTIYPLAKIISEELNIFEEPIATVLEIENNCYTGRIIGNPNRGEEKVRRIKSLIRENNWNLDDSYAYGDHQSDIPILKFSKYPHAINPDKVLEKTATSNNWSIKYWTKTIAK